MQKKYKKSEQSFTTEKIKEMLKLIPNRITVDLEDLKEIFSQNEIRQVATKAIKDKGQ